LFAPTNAGAQVLIKYATYVLEIMLLLLLVVATVVSSREEESMVVPLF